MFYFKTAPFYSTNSAELIQFRRLVRFRKKLEKSGVLFWQYERPLQFERAVREHLIRQLLELAKRAVPAAQNGKKSAPKRRKDMTVGKIKPISADESELQVDGTTPMVFMSASREDSERVLPIYRALADAGFRPWLDVQDLLPGQMWQESIERAISESDVFLVFLSNASGFITWIRSEGTVLCASAS